MSTFYPHFMVTTYGHRGKFFCISDLGGSLEMAD
jgi:hypothetical protein